MHWLQQFIEFFNVFLRCKSSLLQCFSNDQSSATPRLKRPLVDSSCFKTVPSLLKNKLPRKENWLHAVSYNSSFSKSSSSTSLRSMSSSTGNWKIKATVSALQSLVTASQPPLCRSTETSRGTWAHRKLGLLSPVPAFNFVCYRHGTAENSKGNPTDHL